MDNNSKRFNLTLTTPLMSRYAVEKIGYLAEKDGATAILDGTFEYDPKLDEFTNKFLTFLSARTSLPLKDSGVTR